MIDKDNFKNEVTRLNQLYKEFKHQPKTNLERLGEIKNIFEELRSVIEVKPFNSLPVKENEVFLNGSQRIDEIKKQKSLAIKNEDFEKAANLRDEERKACEKLENELGFSISLDSRPFLFYKGAVYYYELDSRVVGII